MKKLFSSIIGIMIIVTTTAQPVKAFDTTFAALLQSKIESYIPAYSLKGISAAVDINGHGLWLGAAGISSETENVNTDMLFGAGSITKNFMSAMVLQLVEADSLDLSDTIGKWLPVYPNVNNAVTIRQLLDHTSGLYNMTDNPAFHAAINSDLTRIWTVDEILSNFILSPYFPPGASWRYSNTNYIILGYIVSRIMHTNLSEQLHQRFFSSYYMNESFFEVEDTIKLPYAHNWLDITGDDILDDIFFIPRTAIFSASSGAGGVTSRPENLLKWLIALYRDNHVLSQASLNEMLTFRNVNISGANGYGLGTMRYAVNGINCYGHGGNIMGYTSVMIYDPVNQIAIAIMMNRDLNGGPVGKDFLSYVMQNIPVGVSSVSSEVPEKFSLYQNYPNPFNPETKIKFDLPSKQYAKLSVINILGEEVQVLYNGVLLAGEYLYNWNAVNFPGGIYFYKLQTDNESVVKKMMLVK